MNGSILKPWLGSRAETLHRIWIMGDRKPTDQRQELLLQTLGASIREVAAIAIEKLAILHGCAKGATRRTERVHRIEHRD